eukprot:NODE_67_length_25542_cov_1.476831.p9 type:complete len:361 gc:universal NODE_67_length_25542_cov_1.476831:7014-5932(-)
MSVEDFLNLKFNEIYSQDLKIDIPSDYSSFQLDIYQRKVLYERYIIHGKFDLNAVNIHHNLLLRQIEAGIFYLKNLTFCVSFDDEKYEFNLPQQQKGLITINPSKLKLDELTPCFQENADLLIDTLQTEHGSIQIMIDQLYGISSSFISKYPEASQFREINNLDSLSSLTQSLSLEKKKFSNSNRINIPISHRGSNFARASPTSPLANSFKDARKYILGSSSSSEEDAPVYLAERRFSGSLARSPRKGSFIGSFEQSLLAGRIPAPFSNPISFDTSCSITFTSSKSGLMRSLPTLNTKFECVFYKLDNNQSSTPYSGNINFNDVLLNEFSDLFDQECLRSGLKIPGKGQIQLVIFSYIAY